MAYKRKEKNQVEKKVLIVYKSVSGFTAKYAEWMKEELGCDVIALKSLKKKMLVNYDILVFGGRIHASHIDGLKKFRRKVGSLNKELIIFASGLVPKEKNNVLDNMWKTNKDEIDGARTFYLQGGLSLEKLPQLDKFVIKSLTKILTKKKDKDESELSMLDALNGKNIVFKKENIHDIVEYIKSL